jgi:mRNA-degrading endonuclease RelE of RelBE toxin-antitoxin system
LSLGNIVHHPFLKLPKPDISKNRRFLFSGAREALRAYRRTRLKKLAPLRGADLSPIFEAEEWPAVQDRIEISEKARDQLRALTKDVRRNIRQRMEAMRDDLRGDVLKLRDKGNRYRLRVGTFRVLFVLAGNVIQVYAVKDRKEAYD